MSDLKPCPFCGGEAMRKTVISPFANEPWHYVSCENPRCRVEVVTAAYAKQRDATKAWNRRAHE